MTKSTITNNKSNCKWLQNIFITYYNSYLSSKDKESGFNINKNLGTLPKPTYECPD